MTNVIGDIEPLLSAGYLAFLSVCLPEVTCMSSSSCKASQPLLLLVDVTAVDHHKHSVYPLSFDLLSANATSVHGPQRNGACGRLNRC